MDKFSDDIARYHEGKLTPAERHALEKRSLSDPFLADALAGAEQISPADFAKDVASLQRKISGEARPLFTPFRIAAGVALLVATGWLGLQLVDNDKPAALTLNEQKPASPSPMGAKDSADAKNAEAVQEKTKPGDEPKKKELLALERPRNKTEGVVTESLQATEPEEKQTEIQADRTDFILSSEEASFAQRDVMEDTIVAADPLIAQPPLQLAAGATSAGEKDKLDIQLKQERASGGVAKMAAADDISRNKITGSVTLADDGQSLPGVTVRVKGSSTGTITDFKGNYEIEVTEDKPTLVFSFVGLQTKEVSPASGPTLDVVLTEDVAQLSEVVVTGRKVPSDFDADPVIKLAEPIGGYKAYDKYLDGNQRYPQQALDNKVKGRVTIQFTVGVDGGLDEFTVMKSLGFGCDEEVIRLVREGPAWNPTTENSVPTESLVRVRMKFDASNARK